MPTVECGPIIGIISEEKKKSAKAAADNREISVASVFFTIFWGIIGQFLHAGRLFDFLEDIITMGIIQVGFL